jgi:hypothetical protein
VTHGEGAPHGRAAVVLVLTKLLAASLRVLVDLGDLATWKSSLIA